MKIKITFFFILLSFVCFSQKQSNRYYPSLKNLMPFHISDKKISEDFNYFDTWIRDITKQTFYKDLQTSSSPKGDASFYSLGLIFKRNNEFNIGNSGIKLIVNKDKDDFSPPVNITMEEKYRILAYLRSFDPNNYNPEDFKNKFSLGLIILNISEEQAMANILNSYYDYDSNPKNTSIQRLVKDLKKEAKIKIEIDEKNDKNILSKIATQIYTQTNRYASDVLYDIYIKSKDKDKEYYNFESFFRPLTSRNTSEFIDETVSYEVNLNVSNKDISVMFPQDIIQVFAKSDDGQYVFTTDSLEIRPQYIEMKTINTIDKKCIEISLVTSKNIHSELAFKALDEIKLNKHPFLPNNERNLQLYKVKDIEKIVISIYESKLEISIFFSSYDYVAVFDRPFSLLIK